MNNIISMKRLVNLIKIDLLMHKKTMVIVAVTMLVILMLLPTFLMMSPRFYFAILYVGGAIITSSAFVEMHDKQKASAYLTLPCSNLEKFISKWFLTSIAYIVITLMLYSFYLLLAITWTSWKYDVNLSMMSFFQQGLTYGIMKYMVFHAIFLLGAVIFKKSHLVKTVLIIALITLTFNIAKTIFAYSVLIDILDTLSQGRIIFWFVVMIFCWYITYLRVSEAELK